MEPLRWFVGCLAVEQGRMAVAAIPLPDLTAPKGRPGKKPAEMRLWVALAGGADILWREQVTLGPSAPPDVREALDKAEDWFVDVERQALGAARGVRVGIAGRWGRDKLTVREIVLLFRLPDGGTSGSMKLIWSGIGNERESRFDYCYLDSFAQFRIVDGTTLERQVQVRASFKDGPPGVSKRLAAKIRKECVAKDREPERFKVAL